LSSSSTAVATTGVRSRRRQNGRDRAAPSSDGATLSLASYRSRAHSLLHDPRPSPRGPSEFRRARAALRPPVTERPPRPRTSSEALRVVGHSRWAPQSRTFWRPAQLLVPWAGTAQLVLDVVIRQARGEDGGSGRGHSGLPLAKLSHTEPVQFMNYRGTWATSCPRAGHQNAARVAANRHKSWPTTCPPRRGATAPWRQMQHQKAGPPRRRRRRARIARAAPHPPRWDGRRQTGIRPMPRGWSPWGRAAATRRPSTSRRRRRRGAGAWPSPRRQTTTRRRRAAGAWPSTSRRKEVARAASRRPRGPR